MTADGGGLRLGELDFVQSPGRRIKDVDLVHLKYFAVLAQLPSGRRQSGVGGFSGLHLYDGDVITHLHEQVGANVELSHAAIDVHLAASADLPLQHPVPLVRQPSLGADFAGHGRVHTDVENPGLPPAAQGKGEPYQSCRECEDGDESEWRRPI